MHALWKLLLQMKQYILLSKRYILEQTHFGLKTRFSTLEGAEVFSDLLKTEVIWGGKWFTP